MDNSRSQFQPGRHWLAIIIFSAIALRLAAALYLGERVVELPGTYDQLSYDALAQRVLAGHGFSFAEDWWPATRAGEPTAHWSYLYTLYLAAVYGLVGYHPLAARSIQAVLAGLLMPWLVYRLGRRYFSPQAGLVAAGLTAGYAYFIYYAAALMTETFYIIAILWTLDLAGRIQNTEHRTQSVLFGIALAVTVLLRQVFLLFVPVLFGWLLWRAARSKLSLPGRPGAHPPVGGRGGFSCPADQPRLSSPPSQKISAPNSPAGGSAKLSSPAGGTEGGSNPRQPATGPAPWRPQFPTRPVARMMGALLIATAVLVAAIAPWTARNYRAFGRLVLLNTNAGFAFFWANHPIHGHNFNAILPADGPSYRALIPPELLSLDEAALDQALLKRGLAFIQQDPGRYLILSLSRIKDYFKFWPSPESGLISNVSRVFSFGLLWPLMAYGFILSLRRLRACGAFSLHLFVLIYSAIHLLSWALIRYRLPVDAVLLVFAGAAIVDIWARLSQRQAEILKIQNPAKGAPPQARKRAKSKI